MNYADDPDNYYQWNVDKARGGSVSSAEEILRGFCEYYEREEPFPEAIKAYIYEAFCSYLKDNTLLEKALHLTAPAHRKKGTTTVDPLVAVTTLYLLIKRDGLNKEEALDKVCEKLHLSKRNLQRYDQEWNLIRDLEIPNLEYLSELPKRSDKYSD